MCADIYDIKGETSADYFVLLCAKCNVPTLNEYLGKDPIMPYFKSKCPKCGSTFRYKMENLKWEGLPDKPAPRVGFFEEFNNE